MNRIPKQVLRRMGFIRDRRGIARRYLNESENWKEHLEKSRSFILRCMEKSRAGGATVLGSGWWLDIPVTELAARFSPLRFVDIYHPPEIRKKAEKYPDIQLIEADITGGVALRMYEAVRNRQKKKPVLAEMNSAGYKPDFDPGFVISLYLSQMDIILMDYWTGYITANEEEVLAFRKQIQQQHLAFLQQHESCLITDTYEVKIYRKSREMTKQLVHIPLPETRLKDHWIWVFDISRTYDPDAVTSFEIQARCLI
ncbi:MAG: hypothetical protein GXO83_01500 [Chlorobi bacterium]|nr:hypothetical protein [Chlorobiota bacterium]